MTCPTTCDDDCDAKCHESHQPLHRQTHVVSMCEIGSLELTAIGLRVRADTVRAPFWKKGAGC